MTGLGGGPAAAAVTGSAHVTLCTISLTAFLYTGRVFFLACAVVAGACAWWLLRDGAQA